MLLQSCWRSRCARRVAVANQRAVLEASFRLLETAGADPAAGLRGSTGEMWRALMWAVLLLLLAESFLARWFGTQHPAGTAARTR